MNLTTAPAVPPLLAGIQLLTFFVDPELGILNRENGQDWVLRTYRRSRDWSRIRRSRRRTESEKGIRVPLGGVRRPSQLRRPGDRDSGGSRRPEGELDNVARTKVGRLRHHHPVGAVVGITTRIPAIPVFACRSTAKRRPARSGATAEPSIWRAARPRARRIAGFWTGNASEDAADGNSCCRCSPSVYGQTVPVDVVLQDDRAGTARPSVGRRSGAAGAGRSGRLAGSRMPAIVSSPAPTGGAHFTVARGGGPALADGCLYAMTGLSFPNRSDHIMIAAELEQLIPTADGEYRRLQWLHTMDIDCYTLLRSALSSDIYRHLHARLRGRFTRKAAARSLHEMGSGRPLMIPELGGMALDGPSYKARRLFSESDGGRPEPLGGEAGAPTQARRRCGGKGVNGPRCASRPPVGPSFYRTRRISTLCCARSAIGSLGT